MSLAPILVVTFPSATDTLMSRSKTPHFMQMHSGQIDRERIAASIAQQEAVEDHQAHPLRGVMTQLTADCERRLLTHHPSSRSRASPIPK